MARKRKPDPKAAALAETRTLNPRPEAVRDEEFGVLGVLRRPRSGAGQIRDGAPGAGGRGRRSRRRRRRSGSPGPSFYEAAAAVDRDGLGGLVPAKPGPRRAHKLTDEVIAYVRQLREQDPRPGVGAAGGRDRREVRDQGAPAVGGAGPGPRSPIPKVEARNEITECN